MRASRSDCASVFTGVVASLMTLPYLKIVGGLALFYIAAKLLVPDDPDEASPKRQSTSGAPFVSLPIADIIMSLDNVIAIAAAAGGNMALLVIGLGDQHPLIVAGAALIMSLLDRFPILVWAGAGVAGLDCRRSNRNGSCSGRMAHCQIRSSSSSSRSKSRAAVVWALYWCWWWGRLAPLQGSAGERNARRPFGYNGSPMNQTVRLPQCKADRPFGLSA